jgi:hypothetical protein
MAVQHSGVDVVLRFHDLSRSQELERALFSLIGQEFRPLRILLCLQRFSDDDVATLQSRIAHLFMLPGAPELTILRYDQPYPQDARSALINLGFGAATGRYLTILDYDDLLYPEAYRMLAARLQETGAAIAFAGIGVRRVDVHAEFFYITSAATAFAGSTLLDLFKQNFCPIHSFMLDRSRVPAEELRFDPMLTIEEDYEFLLRVCSRVRSDFGLIGTMIGEYYYKSNHSNTVGMNTDLSSEMWERVRLAQGFNDARRRVCLISPEVQADLGLVEIRNDLTIGRFLAEQCE